MSKKLFEEMNIQNIANAIREKNGAQDAYTVAQMASVIRNIKTQPNLETLNATENGDYTPSYGKDGFSTVHVDVETESGEAIIQPLSVTQNGTYTPPNGVDGYAPVNVNVPSGGGGSEDRVAYRVLTTSTGSSSAAVSVQKGIYQNGTFTPGSETATNIAYQTATASEQVFDNVIGIQYYSSDHHWEIHAKSSVTLNDHDYITGEVLATWSYQTEVNYIILSKPFYEMLQIKDAVSNGTVMPDSGYYALEKVNVNVQLNLQSKTVNANGLVTPDSGYNGLSSVTIAVPGGGGGDIPLLTRSAWDALTTVQRQAYGLVAIQEASSGFIRGKLVNGADYHPTGMYLPYSNSDNVICEAYGSNYDSSSLSWGYGARPITLSATDSILNADGSVSIMTRTNGTLAYVDLGVSSQAFTAYFVGKIKSASSVYSRLLSCMNSRAGGQGILLYGTSVYVSSWGSDSVAHVNANNYFVGVIQFSGPGTALGAAISASGNTPTFINKSPTVSGQYLTIGRTDINPSPSNAEPTDIDVLYLGVANIAEDTSTIANNMEYLAQQFLSQ